MTAAGATAQAAGYSVNRAGTALVAALRADAARLRLGVERLGNGCELIDAGIVARGGIVAGLRIAELCMGGLGDVGLGTDPATPAWPWRIDVRSSDPVTACLASQYAGWSLAHGEGKQAFHALGSGPGRALARKEPLFAELGYRDDGDATCLVLEVDRRPPEPLTEKIAADCGVAPERLTLVLTPTCSLAGTVQVVARVLEVALHKVHSLGFPLHRVVDGVASAPLPPPAADFVTGMGRTNDAILYGGHVHLFVAGDDADAAGLARALPSGASRDYGRPFAEIFQAYHCNFFDIDPLLFSPAAVTVSCLDSGNSFRAGGFDAGVLARSFGGGS